MNSFSLALNNLRHNAKAYGLHLAVMIFSVVAYYNFTLLKYNPEVLKVKEASDYAVGTSQATAFMLLVFLVFFIWFSSTFFLSQRKKEIGIYAFMGVNNSRIGFVFAVEGFFLGLVALVSGLFIGMMLGKLFIMLVAKFALSNVKISFFVSAKGLIETAIVFLTIFALTSLKGYLDVRKSMLIDLFNASKKEEGLPKVSYIKGILSILLIGAGYYTGNVAYEKDFTLAIMGTIVLVVWGTYWLFGSFFSAVIRFLVGKKKVLYNGVNIVSLSNIAFRIKRNYRTLATIAVLVATTITAFGTVASMKYFVSQSHNIELPYSFSYGEVLKAVSKQVGISFALPLIVGSVHGIAAISVLKKLMKTDLTVPEVISILTFALIYGIFYFATTKKFLSIVSTRSGLQIHAWYKNNIVRIMKNTMT